MGRGRRVDLCKRQAEAAQVHGGMPHVAILLLRMGRGNMAQLVQPGTVLRQQQQRSQQQAGTKP